MKKFSREVFILSILYFLVLVLFLPVTVLSQDFEEANGLYFQGEQEKAISFYLKLIEKEPANINIWVNLALAYRDLGLYPEAISSLKHAARIFSPQEIDITQIEILNLLGWLYYYTGKIEEAENTFFQIHHSTIPPSNHPAKLSALFGLGRVNIEKKNWVEAEKNLKKLTNDNPDFALAYYFLGIVYENLNRLDEAVQMYQQTLKTDSKLVETYFSLGRVYEKQKNYEQAYKQYQKILDIDPLHTEAKTKKEQIVSLLVRPPEEIIAKKKVTLFSSIKPAKEKTKIPVLRIGTGSDEKGAPYPTEKMILKPSGSFLLLKKKGVITPTEEIIFRDEVQPSTTTVYLLQVQIKEPGKMEILDTQGKSLGEYEETIIIRLANPESGTIIVEEVPYGKGFAWASTEDREYRGEIEITPDKKYGLISVNIINLEEYLYSALPSEMYPSAPKEALKAQAVIARSVALFKQKYRKAHKSVPGGGYDLCDEQHCQVYRGVKNETEKVRQAVEETRGEIVTYKDKVINTLFSANCGGHTQSANEIKGWGDEPCLTGIFDGEGLTRSECYIGVNQTPTISSPFGLEKWIKDKPQVYCNFTAENFQPTKFRWVRITPAKDIEERINREYPIGRIQKIIPLTRSKSGHLQKIRIIGEQGEIIIDREYEMRKILGLGFMRSAFFILETKFDSRGVAEEFIFWGGGWGHGVGMCQFGACGMAKRGSKYKEILKHYYQGTEVYKLEY